MSPGNLHRALRRIAAYVSELLRRDTSVLCWRTVRDEPRDEPRSREHAREQTRCQPSPVQCDHGHCTRRENRAHVRARIEDARGKCALAPWEPLRYGLDRSRKIASLTQTQQKSRGRE